MSQGRLSAAELRRTAAGSLAAHEERQEAVLTYLALNGVPAVPVHTGPRVRPRAGGGFDLKQNTPQIGLADVLACLPPHGRLALLDIKSGRARLSRAQRALHARFAAAGALCLAVRDVRDLEPHLPRTRGRIQYHGGNP
jgi:hypothetical protein